MPFLPSRRKGLGAIIEGAKAVNTAAMETMHLSSTPELPEFTLEASIPEVGAKRVILNQGATSSCVAHAFIAGIHIAETRAGLAYVPCSRLFAYYNARRAMGPGMILDNGTFLRTCAEALTQVGVPDEKHWPFSEFTLTVNRRPSFDAVRWAHPRAGGRYVKIFQSYERRLDAIKRALFAGLPVAFGTLVTRAFLDNNGSAHIKQDSSPIEGGHAMLIIGWKTDEQGTVWFRVLNSWGDRWRDRGLCWFHQGLLMDPSADDFHIVYGWNRLREVQS